MDNFTGFGLPSHLLASLERMQYTKPTPIQAQAIPLALAGRDILGSAQTGTGKTAAFGIPLIANLMNKPRGKALVIAPTRELAVQIMDTLQKLLGGYKGIGIALLIGGDSMPAQKAKLMQRPRIIVGTPGRINDHLERGTLMLNEVDFLVLDETDRMLDMGFSPQLDKISKFLTQQRQTLMFSATFPDNIAKLSAKYLNNPERIAMGASNAAIEKIKQDIIYTTDDKKYDLLIKEISEREGSILVFVKTKYSADRLADKLNQMRLSADAIHGNLQQRKRERVIQAFRDMKNRILVATDIAARGLDIHHIKHVINYDMPQCPEDYIHRIGRTARAGAEGSALCFISPEDNSKWKAIHRLMNPGEAPAPHHPAGHIGKPSGGNRKGGPRRNFSRPRDGVKSNNRRSEFAGARQQKAAS
ncbi:MAG: DEAD/DEAH box helicase [Pseudomonadota bacterium]